MMNRILLVLLLCCMVIVSSYDEKAEEDSDEMEDWMKDLVNDGNYFVVASDGDPHEALEIMKKIPPVDPDNVITINDADRLPPFTVEDILRFSVDAPLISEFDGPAVECRLPHED